MHKTKVAYNENEVIHPRSRHGGDRITRHLWGQAFRDFNTNPPRDLKPLINKKKKNRARLGGGSADKDTWRARSSWAMGGEDAALAEKSGATRWVGRGTRKGTSRTYAFLHILINFYLSFVLTIKFVLRPTLLVSRLLCLLNLD